MGSVMLRQLLYFFLLIIGIGRASRGDQDPDYQSCLSTCTTTRLCSSPSSPSRLPLTLRLLGWTCHSNCQYDCMWYIVNRNRSMGWMVWQYHGKWPFVRVLGFQEAASVVGSVGNAWAHLVGWRMLQRALGEVGMAKLYLAPYYRVYFYSSILAWISACLFHTRDVPWTEHADYLTAITSIFIGLYTATLRHLFPATVSRRHQYYLAIPFIALLLYHLHYMIFVSFDYGWNMTLLAILFASYALLWLQFGVRNFFTSNQAKLAVIWVVGAGFCAMLELFEIEPIADLIDAHALWHFGTIPLVLLIWKIYTLDAQDILARKHSHTVL